MKKLLCIGFLFMALFTLSSCAKSEPSAIRGTNGMEYSIERTSTPVLTACHKSPSTVYRCSRNGAILTVAIGTEKVYILEDDMLFSCNPFGDGKFQISDKCYNPGELSGLIGGPHYESDPISAPVDDPAKKLHTLGFCDDYVYFITYGSVSSLKRFPSGGTTDDIETLCDDTVSAFTISEDGVLTGYSGADGSGQREETYKMDLNANTEFK